MKVLVATMFLMLVSAIDMNCEPSISYDGFKVYDVRVKTNDDANFLKSLDGHEGFDFWSLTRLMGSTATVMVTPQKQSWFERSLETLGMEFKVSISDLEKTFATERQSRSKRSRNAGITFNQYHQHEEINEYLEKLQIENSNVEVKTVGKSFEGREIKTIKISNGDGRKKNSIFIDAGIHAREWIAPATSLYVIHQLVENFDAHKDLLENLDWIILPLVNPDGYQHTHKRDRLWRKTRSVLNRSCIGADANRNFDYHWVEAGASEDSCSEIFRGSSAFSEVETQILRDVVMNISSTCKFYLTLHSYGNFLLYPWGWTSDLPENWKDLHEIAEAGANAIKQATGTKYTIGSSTNVLYKAAGGSDDFMLAVANIPISITMELPGGGNSGFDPPQKSIQDSVEESFIGIRGMAAAIEKMFNSHD